MRALVRSEWGASVLLAALGCAALAALAWAALLLRPTPAHARPTYFDTFTSFYGITSGADLHACRVCHFKWTGTGARNPYGNTVEQQLYLGKSITQSIMDVEGDDPDSDGFTSGDEIMNFMTLPGYSCANFHEAIDPPNDWHTFVEPMVASCLVPHDIRVAPDEVGMLAEAGEVTTVQVEVFNNGSSVPLEVSAFGLVDGSAPELTVSGPSVPFTIGVNASVLLDVEFAPEGFI